MKDLSKKVKHQDPGKLRQGYTTKVRALEIGSIVTYGSLMVWLAARVIPHVPESPWLILAAVICGYLAADFVSGYVHWLGDTWGSLKTPLLGNAMIRPFREHHVDQKAITRHDFVETNGNNCLISIPVGVMCVCIPLGAGDYHSLRLFMATFLGAMIFWVMATNQFHKWAHTDDPPPVVAFLQRMHLILPPEHHAIHHAAPYSKYYCITVGWLNWPLHKLRFFQTAEKLTTAWLGWLPRQDDIGEEAAVAAAPELPSEEVRAQQAMQP
jgi:plasmanylethanolamine desaturase